MCILSIGPWEGGNLVRSCYSTSILLHRWDEKVRKGIRWSRVIGSSFHRQGQ